MSRTTLLLRLRTRLVQKCAHHTSSTTPLTSRLLHTSSTTPLTTRLLHTTPAVLKVSGSQRKQFAEELQQLLKRDALLGSGKGRLDFDKVPMEGQDKRAVRRRTKSKSRDVSAELLEEGEQSQQYGTLLETQPEPPVLSELNDTELDQSESHLSGTEPEGQMRTESVESYAEPVSDSPGVEDTAHSVDENSDQVPVNIMGDLEYLFTGVSPPEPVVPEQEGVVETLGSEVDYNIYYNSVEGDRYVMPERALGLRDLNSAIPLDHVIQFVRDYKCFDTEVIQARKGMYVEHVIITSVHNTKHLKDTSRSFFKMCRDDYDMSMSNNEKSNTGHTWKAYDVCHSMVHFFLPVQRAKFNLESFWLGQDTELEDPEQEEERYTSDLLEGLFPDEDFSKLGKPFELFRDSKETR